MVRKLYNFFDKIGSKTPKIPLRILLRKIEDHNDEFSKNRIKQAEISKGRIMRLAEKFIKPIAHYRPKI